MPTREVKAILLLLPAYPVVPAEVEAASFRQVGSFSCRESAQAVCQQHPEAESAVVVAAGGGSVVKEAGSGCCVR